MEDPSGQEPLFRIKNCFLESFAVDYTTSSLPVFIDDDGEPQTTTISVRVQRDRTYYKRRCRRRILICQNIFQIIQR